ncbi:MAG TPA: hypothetical protein PKW70_03260 [Candidatus Pacearchaeota archaeon]|nr:hypothetical protein [Candidatus Pacearchaeota archaeon]
MLVIILEIKLKEGNVSIEVERGIYFDRKENPLIGIEKKELLNISSMMVDFLEGDDNLLSKMTSFDLTKIRKALSFIKNNEKIPEKDKVRLLANSWKIHCRAKPPTPQEFLTEKYIGLTANYNYDRVKDVIINFLDPSKLYRNLILYPAIGFGKSYASTLITLYITVLVSLLRNPKVYLNLNPASVLVQLFLSYNLKKSSEVLLEPALNILEVSPFFERVRTQEAMIKKEVEYQHSNYVDRIFWTTASPSSEISFSNGCNIKLASSVQSLLGLTVVSGVLSELAFFRDAGKSDEYIMRIFNDLKVRVNSRMKNNYLGRVILDSSPNDIDSPIDRYCWYEAHKDPLNYVVKGARWEWAPEDYANIDEKFQVFLGGNGEPPRVLEEWEKDNYDKTQYLEIPKELVLYMSFKNDVVKSLKDIAGIPQGAMNKIFHNYHIIDKCFVDKMKNIYGFITARATEFPENLIWNQVQDLFFVPNQDTFLFHYKPYLPRVLSVDLSYAKDTTGISMCHVEMQKDSITGEYRPIFIIDFSIPIVPVDSEINIDAIKLFILDLVRKGNIFLEKVSYDHFESHGTAQFLKRELGEEIITELSVDKTLGPYTNFIQIVNQGRLRVGRNIFLKNNLKSLQLVRRKRTNTYKIEHTIGDTGNVMGDLAWETSLVGYNAKDLSDAVCASVELANLHLVTQITEEFKEEELILTEEEKEERMKKRLEDLGIKV